MKPLDRLDAAQARSLARLRGQGSDRGLLVELLEASCLLELAKLDARRLDSTSYLQQAVNIIVQMYPVAGCSAGLAHDDGRIIEVAAGTPPEPPTRYPLFVGDTRIGVLVAGPATVDAVDPASFFARAAEQIAQGVGAALDAEELRRYAAAATAARIASEVEESDVVDGLEEVALALASFPLVIAAELVVDHVALGPPLDLRAGYWDDDGNAHSVDSVTLDLGPPGRLTARLRSVDAGVPDDGALRTVLEVLAGSLERLSDTRRLREQAETDALSGLGNRRRLDRSLNQVLARAQRYGEHVAVLLIDLDEFKAVNDELGHEAGDDVIRACASALRNRTRAYDECVRLGGDEFVVVAPVPDLLDAVELAEGIRAAIGTACRPVLPPDWSLSATVGVALFPESGRDATSLLRAADDALYAAKGEGRDGFAVAPEAAPHADDDAEPRSRRRRLRGWRRPGA